MSLPTTVRTSELAPLIDAAAQAVEERVIAWRRDFHAHPELGNREVRTAAIVAEHLIALGLDDVKTRVAHTGVVGVLKGALPGPVVALRADMDGLPVTEEVDVPFVSKVRTEWNGEQVGVMHACGHDIHTALLLGVAAVLTSLKAEVPGTVVFVAQPGEECCDGARLMIEDGAFKEVTPAAFFAYHVDDTLPAGRVGYCSGFMSANVDGFTLEIKSEGCHGASPWSCVDPVVAGAQVVLALQTVVSRETNVWNNTVITVGAFNAGTAPNVIPRSARLQATVRNYGEDQRRVLKDKITRVVDGICRAAGATYDLGYDFGTSSVYNDPALVRGALATAERVLGSKAALVEQKPEMGGEDYSAYGRVAPAVMLNLGVVPAGLAATAVHSPTFIADEAAIAIGVDLMAGIILDHQRAAAKAGAGRSR